MHAGDCSLAWLQHSNAVRIHEGYNSGKLKSDHRPGHHSLASDIGAGDEIEKNMSGRKAHLKRALYRQCGNFEIFGSD